MRANALSSDTEVLSLCDACNGMDSCEVYSGGNEGGAWKKPDVEEDGIGGMLSTG